MEDVNELILLLSIAVTFLISIFAVFFVILKAGKKKKRMPSERGESPYLTITKGGYHQYYVPGFEGYYPAKKIVLTKKILILPKRYTRRMVKKRRRKI